MKRSIWFVVSADKVDYSQEIHNKKWREILLWCFYTSDREGNTTYLVECSEENFTKLKQFFTNDDCMKEHGIIQSGVVENGKFVGWPPDKPEPSDFSVLGLGFRAERRKKCLFGRLGLKNLFGPKG